MADQDDQGSVDLGQIGLWITFAGIGLGILQSQLRWDLSELSIAIFAIGFVLYLLFRDRRSEIDTTREDKTYGRLENSRKALGGRQQDAEGPDDFDMD